MANSVKIGEGQVWTYREDGRPFWIKRVYEDANKAWVHLERVDGTRANSRYRADRFQNNQIWRFGYANVRYEYYQLGEGSDLIDLEENK